MFQWLLKLLTPTDGPGVGFYYNKKFLCPSCDKNYDFIDFRFIPNGESICFNCLRKKHGK